MATSLVMVASSASAQKIVVSMKGPGAGNPFWAALQWGREEKAAELGVEVVDLAPPTESDVPAQIAQIEDQLVKGAAGIVLAPTDPNALGPVVIMIHGFTLGSLKPEGQMGCVVHYGDHGLTSEPHYAGQPHWRGHRWTDMGTDLRLSGEGWWPAGHIRIGHPEKDCADHHGTLRIKRIVQVASKRGWYRFVCRPGASPWPDDASAINIG